MFSDCINRSIIMCNPIMDACTLSLEYYYVLLLLLLLPRSMNFFKRAVA